jgi:putative salt-induced outer membrane protein YdiY
LWALWAGYVDLGLATTEGNSKTLVFNTAMKTTRVTRNDTTSAYFTQILARSLANGKTADTAKSIRGGWMYDRNLHPRLFINTFNDWEYDAFQNLDLRAVFGGGPGYRVVKSERFHLDALAGGNYSREQFSINLAANTPGATPTNTRNSGELFWGDDLLYKVSGNSSVHQSFRMFDNLSRTGEYRVNLDLGIDSKLKKWLSWQITASDHYLTNPAPGRKTNDLIISSGLRFSFAR